MKFPRPLPFLLALSACAVVIAHGGLQARASATPAQEQSKRSYVEAVLSPQTNDKKAEDIVRKVMAADIQDMREFVGRDAKIYAQFVALGPSLPKNAILATFDHPAVCGSSGCRTVILTPDTPDAKKYALIYDTTLGRIFFNYRQGQTHYDILALVLPRATDGFGVSFWSEEKKAYVFVGISKFDGASK